VALALLEVGRHERLVIEVVEVGRGGGGGNARLRRRDLESERQL